MATKAERIPRYVDEEGLYLDVLERDYDYQIGWYLPDEQEFGLIIDNDPSIDKDNQLVVQALVEFCVMHDLELPRTHEEFRFETKTQAAMALRAINAKFHYRGKTLPEWAEKALAAGWSAPKGWKP